MVLITKDHIEEGKNGKLLIESIDIKKIQIAIKADLMDTAEIERFGLFMFDDLNLDEIEYEEYINKIIEHYNRIYGTPEKRGVAIPKNKIVKKANDNERDIETEVIICIATVLSMNFFIIFSVLVLQFVLRRTLPGYFGSKIMTWAFSFIILVGIGVSTYFIGYRNHLLKPYCRVGFKNKEEYRNWGEKDKFKYLYSVGIILAILFFMSKQILPIKKEHIILTLFLDPLFFIFNSILACWPSKDDFNWGYSLERHARLNSNTFRNLILGEDRIEPPPTVPFGESPAEVQIPPQTETGPTQQQLDAEEREFEGQMDIFNEQQEEYQRWKDSVPHGREDEWNDYRFEEQRDDADERSRPGVAIPSGLPPPHRMTRPTRRWPNVVPGIITQSGGGQAISAVGKFFYRFFYIIAILMCQSVYTCLLLIALFYIISREVSGSYSNMTHIGCIGG